MLCTGGPTVQTHHAGKSMIAIQNVKEHIIPHARSEKHKQSIVLFACSMGSDQARAGRLFSNINEALLNPQRQKAKWKKHEAFYVSKNFSCRCQNTVHMHAEDTIGFSSDLN